MGRFGPLRDRRNFLKYCWENELEKVKVCLTRNVDISTVSEDGCWSALTIAAYKNYLDLLNLLLSQPEININQTCTSAPDVTLPFGLPLTALMFACGAGNSDIVSRLVEEEDLAINYQTLDGLTAAHLACHHGHTECVRLLARTGKVDWNIQDTSGDTPLHFAIRGGHCDIVDIIVKIPGINFNVKTGVRLAHSAILKGCVRSVEILASQKKFDCWNVLDINGNTLVMMALDRGDSGILKILLGCPRVDLTIRDKYGWSLVMMTIAGKKLGEC